MKNSYVFILIHVLVVCIRSVKRRKPALELAWSWQAASGERIFGSTVRRRQQARWAALA